jgi:hypothetical protein
MFSKSLKRKTSKNIKNPMNKQLVTLIALLMLMFAFTASTTASAHTIDLKKGDWIEYQVDAVGDFPGEHNVNWTRIEVVDMQGELIFLNVTVQLTTGPYAYYNDTIDFETGELMEGFFLPSNVTEGDVFFDTLVGYITVGGVEHRTYGGADRTLILGIAPETVYYYDKATGIMVEAHSSYPDFNYTVDTVAVKTNLWQPQILGLEPTVFYTVSVGAATAVAVVIVLIVISRRKKVPKEASTWLSANHTDADTQ